MRVTYSSGRCPRQRGVFSVLPVRIGRALFRCANGLIRHRNSYELCRATGRVSRHELVSREQTGDRETVEYGTESGAKDCRGGMWDVRYSSSTQTGQRRISAGPDTGSDRKKRWKDINKQTG